MSTTPHPLFLLVSLVLVAPLPAQQDEPADRAAQRSAREILAEFHSVVMPSMSDGDSPEALEAFHRQIRAGCTLQAELALELCRDHPDHRQVPDVMRIRWAVMCNALGEAASVLDEAGEVLDREPEVSAELRRQALHARARASVLLDSVPRADKLAAIEAVIEQDPDDELCGIYLMDVARCCTVSPRAMREICERVVEGWPESAYAGRPARSLLRQLDKVGEPFPLNFEDLLSGERIDDGRLRGGPVLVQIWSGDSERVRAELDAVKEIERRWAPHGLRVVGIHNWRVDGGADALRKMLREQAVTWPHLYDEVLFQKPWEGPYAVPQTPFYYLCDADGKVCALGFRAAILGKRIRAMLSGY